MLLTLALCANGLACSRTPKAPLDVSRIGESCTESDEQCAPRLVCTHPFTRRERGQRFSCELPCAREGTIQRGSINQDAGCPEGWYCADVTGTARCRVLPRIVSPSEVGRVVRDAGECQPPLIYLGPDELDGGARGFHCELHCDPLSLEDGGADSTPASLYPCPPGFRCGGVGHYEDGLVSPICTRN
jgi:hypothetical protein